MTSPFVIHSQADSLMELLAAQCADLESLLALARQEALAAERQDFAGIMQVVDDRAGLSERLENYHRQIAEIRARLGSAGNSILETDVVQRTRALALQIQTHDARSHSLLLTARAGISEQAFQLDQTRRSANAYLQSGRPVAVACDLHL